MKLAKILKEVLSEVGEATTEPYYYEKVIDDENNRVYNFETDSTPPTWYEVDLKEIEPNDPFSDEGIRLNINFGVTDEEGNKNMNVVTNKGEFYRVMSTVLAIVKNDLKNHTYIKALSFEPSKRKEKDISSNARANIYLKYIGKAFPSASTSTQDGSIVVKLK